jgi:hypothetical protein
MSSFIPSIAVRLVSFFFSLDVGALFLRDSTLRAEKKGGGCGGSSHMCAEYVEQLKSKVKESGRQNKNLSPPYCSG